MAVQVMGLCFGENLKHEQLVSPEYSTVDWSDLLYTTI